MDLTVNLQPIVNIECVSFGWIDVFNVQFVLPWLLAEFT